MFLQRIHKPCPRLAHLVIAWSVFLALGGVAQAQPEAEALARDLWQTMQARKLLLEDPQLAPLNVGVKVANRVAILWGPIPSQELAFRVEQRLRIMFELVEIRNRLTIEPDDNVPPNAPPVPEMQRVLPERPPPVLPNAPRRPALVPQNDLKLAGISPALESVTARSSPLGPYGSTQPPAGLATFRMPFFGSITVPR